MEERGTLMKPISQTPVHREHVTRKQRFAIPTKIGGPSEQVTPQSNPVHVSHEQLLVSEEAYGQDPKSAAEVLPLKTQPPVKDLQSGRMYFSNDHQHTVDFVLVWDQENSAAGAVDALEKRKIFEENLKEEGLKLEEDRSLDNGLVFVKIHAPQAVLRCYAEILKLQLPMKNDLCKVSKDTGRGANSRASTYLAQKMPALVRQVSVKTGWFFRKIRSCKNAFMSLFYVDEKVFPPRGQRYTAVFSRDKEYLFDVNSPLFFPPSIRSQIVEFILDRSRFCFEEEDEHGVGIQRLTADGVYNAAYPLHDGDIDTPGSMRYLLYHEWASLRKVLRYQPLDYVKDYFGVKIALYFAWLGFYTNMLILPALVGLLCFVYSWATLNSNLTGQDICDSSYTKECPLCDVVCGYWLHDEACQHVYVTYLFDNGTMVFLAVFMSFWAALFLELWKRYSAEITHRWDLCGFDIEEEHPRPQYLARLAHVKQTRVNVTTNQVEPRVSFWFMKLPTTMLSYSVFILLIVVGMVALLGVVWYRLCFEAAVNITMENYSAEVRDVVIVAIAALINFAGITLFKWVYPWVAVKLTEFELLRTQTEFDESLSLKIYLLQFVNYYSSIMYIAFFKGTFVDYYTVEDERQFRVFRKECGPTGCLTELSIQLATIMIGNQLLSTFLEMIFPLFKMWYNMLKVTLGRGSTKPSFISTQWMEDYMLVLWGPRQLFAEYSEMVLQYGFATIFVAAFPLAPFFALVNNVLELRLDAKKLLKFHRRPVAQRIRDIGVWYRILDSIGKLSVVTNGCIIAFTADFIPRFVYKFMVRGDNSLNEMWHYSLDEHYGHDFEPLGPLFSQHGNVSFCQYNDFDKTHWAMTKYTKLIFWIVLAARLAFIVVFENVVVLVVILVHWCIPEMPKRLHNQIRHEMNVINDFIIKQETARVLRCTPKSPLAGPSSAPINLLQEDAVILMIPASGRCGSPGGGGGSGEIPSKALRTKIEPLHQVPGPSMSSSVMKERIDKVARR